MVNISTLLGYVAFTRTTARYDQVNPAYEIGYLTLGLINELGELEIKGHDPAEAGDVMWYVARLADATDTLAEFVHVFSLPSDLSPNPHWKHQLAGRAKKFMRGDENGLKKLQIFMPDVYGAIHAYLYNFDLKAVLDYNMSKLDSRRKRGTLKGDGDER